MAVTHKSGISQPSRGRIRFSKRSSSVSILHLHWVSRSVTRYRVSDTGNALISNIQSLSQTSSSTSMAMTRPVPLSTLYTVRRRL